MHLFGSFVDHLLQTYGYWAVFVLVLLETTGIPSPGETALVAAGAYAGATHRLSIAIVVGAAAAAAIIGDNLGFWIGREGGWRLLCRYGKAVHVEDWMLKVGVYVFRRHGAKIVFFARFIPILRTWGALLTGVNRYPWSKFLTWNAAGGICWAVLWGRRRRVRNRRRRDDCRRGHHKAARAGTALVRGTRVPRRCERSRSPGK